VFSEELSLPDVKVLAPKAFEDDRGWFCETYSKRALAQLGITDDFVQDNHSHSRLAGTVRGLHYQSPPFAQAKLVRVSRGQVWDVVVDARRGSPTFGAHVGVELSAQNRKQLYVPVGFLHGFVTRTPDVDLVYKVSNYYAHECDGAVAWNDPALGIDWGVDNKAAVLSQKDADAGGWDEFDTPFVYQAPR